MTFSRTPTPINRKINNLLNHRKLRKTYIAPPEQPRQNLFSKLTTQKQMVNFVITEKTKLIGVKIDQNAPRESSTVVTCRYTIDTNPPNKTHDLERYETSPNRNISHARGQFRINEGA